MIWKKKNVHEGMIGHLKQKNDSTPTSAPKRKRVYSCTWTSKECSNVDLCRVVRPETVLQPQGAHLVATLENVSGVADLARREWKVVARQDGVDEGGEQGDGGEHGFLTG